MRFGISIFKEHFFHFEYIFERIIEPYSLEAVEFKIEPSFFNEFQNKIGGYVKKLRDFKDDIFLSLHLPIEKINISHPYKPLREASISAIKRSIDIGIGAGIKRGVIHPPYNEEGVSDLGDDEFLKIAFSSMVEIADFCKELGFECLLENKGMRTKRKEFFSDLRYFEEAQRLFSGIVFDLGHLNLSGMHYDYFYCQFKDRIFEVHLHKNEGLKDEHKEIEYLDDNILRFFLKIKDRDISVILEHEKILQNELSLKTLNEWFLR